MPPRGHLAMSGDNFDCCDWGEMLLGSRVEAKEVAKHSTGQLPTTQNYLTPNTTSAKVEKPCE